MREKTKKKLMKITKTILKIVIMLSLIVWLDYYGVAVIGLFFIFWGLYRLFFSGWDMFIQTKQMIECYIWGQPLKEFKPGELKNHKVKIVWRKKNDDKTNKHGKSSKTNKT